MLEEGTSWVFLTKGGGMILLPDYPNYSANWQGNQLINGSQTESLRVKRSNLYRLGGIGVHSYLPRPAASQRFLPIHTKKPSFSPMLRMRGDQVLLR